MSLTRQFLLLLTTSHLVLASEAWKEFAGHAGATGWRCHVIQPDPGDDGPDGINFHDWDGDGDLDVFANYEEGKYSRLYFNPGKSELRSIWKDYIEFAHGKCEDSGIGDLDDDGDVDYIANGGWVYFNPGKAEIRDPAKWVKMSVFDHEQRVPVVADIDGDGLNDLVVGGQHWFRQPGNCKHEADNWTKYQLGSAKWPMSCIVHDVNLDSNMDLVVADRRDEIFWLENPGKDEVRSEWTRKKLHPHGPMFMTIGDVNGDGLDDMIFAGGKEGVRPWKMALTILLRTNRSGDPKFKEIIIDQPCGNFTKGVGLADFNGDGLTKEIVVVPQVGDLWLATYQDDAMKAENWTAEPIPVLGAHTRKKMDNAYLADLDGDGDTDIVTTEENGGWGVIWFENPR